MLQLWKCQGERAGCSSVLGGPSAPSSSSPGTAEGELGLGSSCQQPRECRGLACGTGCCWEGHCWALTNGRQESHLGSLVFPCDLGAPQVSLGPRACELLDCRSPLPVPQRHTLHDVFRHRSLAAGVKEGHSRQEPLPYPSCSQPAGMAAAKGFPSLRAFPGPAPGRRG